MMRIVTTNRSCRCVVFDQAFSSNNVLKQFSRLIRPILYGKIYYHPSNIHYDGIIKRVNQTFESLDELTRLLRQIHSVVGPSSDMLSLLCSLSIGTSRACREGETYQSAMTFLTIVTELLACTDRNRFVAMSSEAEMVRQGQNNSVTDTFLAAIKFIDEISNNDSLPKHIRFKIRMVLDRVDSTFRTEDLYVIR
jgi:uncharacterized protein (UPF0147 family)